MGILDKMVELQIAGFSEEHKKATLAILLIAGLTFLFLLISLVGFLSRFF